MKYIPANFSNLKKKGNEKRIEDEEEVKGGRGEGRE